MDLTYKKIIDTIQMMIDMASGMENNAAYQIYQDLHKKLILFEGMEAFLETNTDIRVQFENQLTYIKTNPGYNQNHIAGCHLLGFHLEEILKPRFIKEKKSDSNINPKEHICHWFQMNSSLDLVKDKYIVQAAFLVLFYI